MKRMKGSITIFLTAMFATIVVVYTSFIDMLTYRDSLKNAINSNKICADYYGMMKNYDYEGAIGLSYYEMDASLTKYQSLLKEEQGTKVSANATTDITLSGDWVSLTGDNYHNLETLMRNYMQYQVDENDISHYDRTLYELNEAEIRIASYEGFSQMNQAELADACFQDGFYNIFRNTLHYGRAISQQKYNARNVMKVYGEETGWSKEDTLPSYSHPSLKEELQSLNNKFLSEKQNGPSTSCVHITYGEELPIRNEVELWFYMNHYMTNASLSGTGMSGLKGEQEYILFGYRTDGENIARAAEEIMKYRLAANYYALAEYVYTEEMMETEAEESAETGESDEAVESDETLEPEEPAESREGMILNHAIRESYYDVLTLLAGGKVPTIKTADEIRTEREQPLESIHAGRETSGLSYSDYLSYLILYNTGCAEMVNDAKCFMHTADWIEYITGRDADAMYTRVVIKAVYSTKIRPLSLVGALCNKMGSQVWDITIY